MAANPSFKSTFGCFGKGKLTQFTNANGATEADIWTAEADDMVDINSIMVSTDESTTIRVVQFYISDGSNSYPAWAESIPLESGTKSDGSIAAVDAIGAGKCKCYLTDGAGNKFIRLPKGWNLRAKCLAAPTSGKVVNVFVTGASHAVPA